LNGWSGLVNRPCAELKYLAPKKSSPVSASLSLEVLRDLLPESYKQAAMLVVVLELATPKP